MGRDFTPKDFNWADKQYEFSKKKTIYHNDKGEEIVLYNPTSAPDYPHLNFLFHENFEELFKEWGKCETLDEIERCIDIIIKNENIGVPPSNWQRIGMDEYIATTSLWYEGKLDKHFYYATENNRIFEEFIRKKYNENNK